MNIKKIIASVVITMTIVSIMVTGCTKATPVITKDQGSESKYGQINGGNPITINLDMNNYLPSINETPTDQSPIVFRSIQVLADEFMKLFPNVKIEWDRTKISVGNWSQWMTTQLAANAAPDVVMLHGSEFADRGWYVRLNEELEKPNIFVEGNSKWKDMFPEYLWQDPMTTDVNGNIVAIPTVLYPGTATAYYYNKEIFSTLSLTPPKTWEEFKTVCEKINKAGYIAVGPWSLNKQVNVGLWDIQFSLGPSYAKKMQNEWDYDSNGIMTPDELLRASYEGKFDASTNPAVLDLFSEIKYKYTKILQDGAENTEYESLWVQGKVGMMEDGLWRIPAEEANTERKFEYGMFPVPVATSTTSEYASDITWETGPYQPPIAESYNIVKATVEKKGAGSLEASLKFFQFLTKPENLNQMVLEKNGESIGAVIGTKIPPQLDDWFKQEFPRIPKAHWITGPTVSSAARMSRQLEMWVKGMISDEDFKANYDKELKKGVDEQIAGFNIDTGAWD
ncbi:MAG: ABC transporter substrate-binding protein [Saccharofermentanales bacterium]